MAHTYLLAVAKCLGREIRPGDRILDFGCGSGTQVYRLRGLGFEAYGCDLQFKPGPYVPLLSSQRYIRTISDTPYRLPFPSNSFDVVFSEQVFEHVSNYDQALQELARVMKPGAIGLHRFPSRLRPIESHIGVPLSSIIRRRSWMLLWVILGVRKPSERDKAAQEVAASNLNYLNERTNYLTGDEISRHFRSWFTEFGYADGCWLQNSPNRRGRVLATLSRVAPFLPLCYRVFWTRMVYHRK